MRFSPLIAGLGVFAIITSLAATMPPPPPQNAQTSAPPGTTELGWPREFSNDEQITIYEPQVESWQENRLDERAAVSVQTKASAEPTYGVIWLSARTEVDKTNHMVTLEDIQIKRGSFPAKPEKTDEYLSILRKNTPGMVKQVALDRLQANLAITKAESKVPAPQLKNTPPKIIYSKTPAILVLVDGDPVLRDSGAAGYMRVINSRALLVLDQSTGSYYLYVGDRWMKSTSVTGNWTAAANPPPGLEQAKKVATDQKLVDLLNDPNSPLMQQLEKGVVPRIYVSEKPAELIQTSGSAQLKPVSGTGLLFVENSGDSIFLNTNDQNYYVLVSGRWYRSRSLNGPWAFVSAKKLPRDFAKIPESHPKGSVLASVAGTPQAQEAGIANEIPQTATVNRNQAQLQVHYDGAPNFQPIAGTPLLYAVNSQTPVIQVDAKTFYAVQNGVWFVATSADGPWVVATTVPSVIYTIPPSSPLYYVTYVRIYGSSPEVVYTGYTPGYLGSYSSDDGVVVYGTGYWYPGWYGSVWYGYPVTYGCGWYWGPGFGWGFGVGFYTGFFIGAAFWPWWGPWGGWWGPGYYHGTTNVTVTHTHDPSSASHYNAYRNWSGNTVRNTWSYNRAGPQYYGGGVNRPNNVYAGRNGEVYRYSSNGGWQQRTPEGSWQRSPSSTHEQPNLEQNRMSRQEGEQNWNQFRSGGGGTPEMGRPGGAGGAPGGGYSGGGGGNRAGTVGGGPTGGTMGGAPMGGAPAGGGGHAGGFGGGGGGGGGHAGGFSGGGGGGGGHGGGGGFGGGGGRH